MKFAVIDNYRNQMPEARKSGFDEAMSGQDYEYVRHDQIRCRDLSQCRGIILSGSEFDLARPDDSLDRPVYELMVPEFQFLREFTRPALGICFGHQLMAIAEEFDAARTEFGALKIAMMKEREQQLVREVTIKSPALFLQPGSLWAQFNHKLEALPNHALEKYFHIVSSSRECPVDVIQHKSRPWVGVQFHPEVGIASKNGILEKHAAAAADGRDLIRRFVQYCLK